ncbi:MAG: hypothetical protein ACI4B6_07725 [Atopobiaceae bacterium]
MRFRIPVGRVAEVMAKGREAWASLGAPLVVHVWVDAQVPRWLAQAVKGALVPQMGASEVVVRDLEDLPLAVDASGAQMAMVLAGGSDRLVRSAIVEYATRAVPVAVCAQTSLDVPDAGLGPDEAALVRPVIGSQAVQLLDGLCAWMLDVSGDPVSVAANFTFCREAETERLIQRCALSNAAVGTVDVLHGADLPIMLANQSKLAFDIAAAHGEGMSASRVAELAAVVCAGLAYRAVSRAITSRVPGLGFVVRGAVGYAGSVATGRALALRFGEDPLGVGETLRSLVGADPADGTAVAPQTASDQAATARRPWAGLLEHAQQVAQGAAQAARDVEARREAAQARDADDIDVVDVVPDDDRDDDSDDGYIVLTPGGATA